MAVVLMSDKELGRVQVLADTLAHRLPVAEAAAMLGIGRRQVFRLLKAFRAEGGAGLVSRRRGRPSNRRYPPAIRAQALGHIREHYADFGPTLAAEKLREMHGLRLAPETVRQWMLAGGLWADRKTRSKPVHQPRSRRDCPGELVQIDGSRHWWFEDRGPPCTLLVFIDDATSRLMHLRFVLSETAFDYFRATRAYLEAHGKPVAFYSDRHSIFRVGRAEAAGGDGMTQFGRALHALNIDILCANSPQAKGRVERANKTLQDRLVKELRLRGISTIDAANAMLPGFVAGHNARFAKVPRSPRDLHRPLSARDDVDAALTWREERTVSHSLTLQYDKVLFLLEPSEVARGLARRRVTVFDYPDGRLEIRYRGRALPYTTFDKLRHVPRQAPVVERKNLDTALERAKFVQARRDAGTPPAKTPASKPATAEDRLEAALTFARERQARQTTGRDAKGSPTIPPSATPAHAEDRLEAALAFVRERQARRVVRRSARAPRRRGQAGHMFGTG
jgi:Winged helix-turn helix